MRCSSASDNVRERERDGVGTSVSCAVGMLKISLCRKKREIFWRVRNLGIILKFNEKYTNAHRKSFPFLKKFWNESSNT